MNKNSIIATSTNFPDTTAVSKHFDALVAVLAESAVCEAILKEAKGELCEAPDFIPEAPTYEKHGFSGQFYLIQRTIKERTLQREQRRIVYYAARLRVQNMIQTLKVARINLVNSASVYREIFDGQVGTMNENERDHEIGRINIFFCDQLAFEAYERLRQLSVAISHGVGIDELWANGQKIDLSASLKAEYARSERVWEVKYSGHGSDYRHSGANPDSPPRGPHLTFDEARADAENWEGIADTIGGAAILYNVRTQATVSDYRYQI